tara:strand:- start:517 stop:1023 length:507 start_codon:yes stop_codon:yes gene_type:complete
MENKLSTAKVYFVIGRTASGKSTVSTLLYNDLSKKNKCIIIDPDDLSKYNIKPLPGDFSFQARIKRNEFLIRIISWLSEQSEIIIVSAIGQPEECRNMWKENFKHCTMIYLKSDLETCEKRDFKGIYKLKENVIGKHLPFHEPLDCDIIIDVNKIDAQQAKELILTKI